MQVSNKINTPRNSVNLDNTHFQQFVQTLKQQRILRSPKLQHSQPNHSQISQQPAFDQETPLSKDIYSERSRSLHLQNPRVLESNSRVFEGDEVLRHKGRYGAANRATAKQYLIPPQYFTPTKVKLQQYLKDSRILSNGASSSKVKAAAAKQAKYWKGYDMAQLESESGKIEKGAYVQAEFTNSQPDISNHNTAKMRVSNNDFRIRAGSQRLQLIGQQANENKQKHNSFYNGYAPQQSEIDPWSYPQPIYRVAKTKPRSSFNQLLEFSYPYDVDFVQQRVQRFKQQKAKSRFENSNPEHRNWDKVVNHQKPSRKYEHDVAIREQTDYGQQQPLQLKC